MHTIISKLLQSEEPAIRWKVRVGLFGEDPEYQEIKSLREEIRTSQRVKMLLSERGPDGRIPFHPYAKFYGAHWVLPLLAESGYPTGDESLFPLREQVLEWLFSKTHRTGIQVIEGRTRRCTSQEANALYAMLTLGIDDERAEKLALDLVKWQWPDGGWNCDKRPQAHHASFHESWIPVKALALYSKKTGYVAAKKSLERAVEMFLQRKLMRRLSTNEIIDPEFTLLHYPNYWHYDFLQGLRIMAEAGYISDPRCQEALDLLESKRLPDGGFPADGRRFHHFGDRKISGKSLVQWGKNGKTTMNEFVTAETLALLKIVGRFDPQG